jgi:transposase
MGYSRSGISTKIHCAADTKGRPVDFILSGGQVHDSQEAEALIRDKTVKYVIADKGYDAKKIDAAIHGIGAIAAIPVRTCFIHLRKREYPQEIFKKRSTIERLFNRLKGFRRLGTRYDRKAVHFLGMVYLAGILVWLT